MEALLLVVVLGAAVLVGTTIGGRYSVAPPVLLIVGGALLALVPQLSQVTLPPEAVLLVFLPPILYYESFNVSLREIRANLRVIILNAVLLVIATMVVISYALQAIGVPAAAAWILGAVLAPTDAAAVAGLAKRMPRRTLTTLRAESQAESLINDGTALVLVALTAIAVAIASRLAWVHLSAWVIRLVDRRAVQRSRRVNWRVRTAAGWAGFRGAVSLAAALAPRRPA